MLPRGDRLEGAFRVPGTRREESGMTEHEATAEVTVDAPATQVWRGLTEPELIAQYMFGSRVVTDWQVGSPIVWKGEFEGRSYEDKGEVLEVRPERHLSVTHFSPMTGQE